MPAWKPDFLEEAIRSIVGQTFPDWELVVVDDCSPHDLRSVVESFQDDRIRYERNESNLGGSNLVRQWNHCIGFASAPWLVLAADDDVYDKDFCADCVSLTRKYPGIDLVRSRVLQIDEQSRPLYDDGLMSEYSSKYEYLHDWLTGKAFTCIGNFMFRTSALRAVGGFIDFPCAFGSDIATPIQLSVNGVANTQRMLFSFRQSAVHLSSDCTRFREKLAAITELSLWLRAISYPEPESEQDRQFYSIYNEQYLQAKCIYDYFNLVIRYVPFTRLPEYLKLCTLATFPQKCMMVLRWFKRRYFDTLKK